MDKRTPKVVRKFKQRVMDFLFDAVDDVVGLVYENNKRKR